MTGRADREVILERIRRLFALSEDGGATAGEASTAAKMAARLMARYQLSPEEVRVSRDGHGGLRVEVTENDVSQTVWTGPAKRMPAWQRGAAVASARATSCQVYRSPAGLVFVGAFRDAALACEVQQWLVSRCERDTRRFLRGATSCGATSRMTASSFRAGWVAGVQDAVAEEIEQRQRDQAHVREHGGGGAHAGQLVVVSLKEVAEAKAVAVGAWLERNVSLRRSRPRSFACDAAAYGAGHVEGSSVRVGTGANLE